jgi:uncharacterized delta-60 repeat protein
MTFTAADTAVLATTPIAIVGSDSSGVARAQAWLSVSVGGRSGSLDTTFGDQGKLSFNAAAGNDEVDAIAIQPDGNIVVGGGFNGVLSTIARLRPDGSFDASFGAGGVVRVPYGAGTSAIAIQPDGKIVATLSTFDIVRLLANGMLDPSFGPDANGLVSIGQPVAAQASAVAVQPDGKIVIAGTTYGGRAAVVRLNIDGSLDQSFNRGDVLRVPEVAGTINAVEGTSVALVNAGATTTSIFVGGTAYDATTQYAAVLRVNASDGTLDATFGSNGIAIASGPGTANAAPSFAVQSDGKVVCGGISYFATPGSSLFLTRFATDGSVDTSFGTNGVVAVGTPAGAFNEVHAVALQADGKIVTAGRTTIATLDAYSVARFTTSGALDPTFATGGLAAFSVGSSGFANAAAILPNGTVVVAGSAKVGTRGDFGVARLATNGTLDTSFGTSGKATLPISNGNDEAESVAIAPNGSVLLAGGAFNGNDEDFLVVRLTPDGALDTTFGTDGVVTNGFGPGTNDYGFGVSPRADGSVVASGLTGSGTGVLRYTSSGALDATFGAGGKAIPYTSIWGLALATDTNGTMFVAGADGQSMSLFALDANATPLASFGPALVDFGAQGAQAHGVARDKNGAFVLGGYWWDTSDRTNPDDFALARVTSAGTVDTTFGTAGHVRVDLAPTDYANAVAIQDDGRIVATGTAQSLGATGADFALIRLLPTGELDTSFGNAGRVIMDLGGADEATSVLVLPNGDILAGGTTTASDGSFVLACYLPTGALDPLFGDGGILRISFGPGQHRINSLALRPDGRIVAAGYARTSAGDLDTAVAQVWP